jgi:hypothetical protein
MLWPLPAQATRYSNQRTASASGFSAVNVPTGGTAHTKGSWTTLVASTAIDASVLRLYMGGHTSTGVASPALVDIGIGSASNEVVILSNLDVGNHGGPLNLQIPMTIPAGTRIAARAQGARTAVNITIAADLNGEQGLAGSNIPTAAVWTSYGVSTASSIGTAITPGNTNTWGSWVSLGTTTSEHNFWLALFDMGANTTVTSITYRIQLAVAANTTEASAMATANVLQGDTIWFSNNTEYSIYQSPHSNFAVSAPTASGLNIYARGAASGTAQTVYVAAYGGS